MAAINYVNKIKRRVGTAHQNFVTDTKKHW